MRRMQKDAMSEAIWLVSGLTKRHALTPGHLPLLSKEPAVIRTCRQLAIIPRKKERGGRAIAKALDVNSTLTQLNLGLTFSRGGEGGR